MDESSRPEPDLSILLEWLRSEGGLVHESLIVSSDAYDGSCLRTTKRVDADRSLIMVPRSMMLEAPSTMSLAIRLIEEVRNGTSSYWHLYWPCLPLLSSLSFLPLVHHFQEVGEEAFLSGTVSFVTRLASGSTSLSSAFEAQRQDLIKDFSNLPASLSCSIKEWLWAYCIVKSRALNLWGGPSLVPVVDLLNHTFPPNVRVSCRCGSSEKSIYSPPSTPDSSEDEIDEKPHDSQFLVIESVSEMEEDAELLWCYNSHETDAHWLLSYGFVPEESRPEVGKIDELALRELYHPDQELVGSIPGIFRLIKREVCCGKDW